MIAAARSAVFADDRCDAVTMLLPAVITFANGAMLAATAAVALPVAVHLLNRRQPRTVVFPTVRFLRAAAASQSRVHRLRHLILLGLRCAFIALLALAFARPVWFRSADAAAAADRDTVAILVLDLSASMSYVEPPLSLAEQARTKAAAVLDGLRSSRNDHANIIRLAARPDTALVEPTTNLALLRQRLEQLTPTAERAEVNAALELAARQFDSFRTSRRELHIFSDFQRTNWQKADFSVLPRNVAVLLHRFGPLDRPNACVESVAFEPPRPLVDTPCRVRVRLANHAPAAQKRTVTLRVDREREWKRSTVPLEPGRPADVSFELRFDRAGPHEVVAAIEPDHLAIDDRAFATVDVLARPIVALCTDADLSSGTGAAYFLSRALSPHPSGEAPVDLRILSPDRLAAAPPPDAEVVFLDVFRRLTGTELAGLDAFLNDGGGLVVFLGPGAVVENLAELSRVGRRPRMPFEPGEIHELPAQADAVRIERGSVQKHPILEPFAGPPMQSLENIGVRRFYTARDPRTGVPVLARFTTGDIVLGVARNDRGAVLLCNISPDPAWSDLARHAAFPALVHEFARFLRPNDRADTPLYVGAPARRYLPLDGTQQDLTILDPAERTSRLTIRRQGSATVFSHVPTQPGIYRIRAGDTTVGAFAANVDPAESILRADDDRTVTAGIRSIDRAQWAGVEAAASPSRDGTPLWAHALAGALAVLAVEMMCLKTWRR